MTISTALSTQFKSTVSYSILPHSTSISFANALASCSMSTIFPPLHITLVVLLVAFFVADFVWEWKKLSHLTLELHLCYERIQNNNKSIYMFINVHKIFLYKLSDVIGECTWCTHKKQDN
jgi:hypothetical protein